MPDGFDKLLQNDWPASGCPGRFRLVQAQAGELDAPEQERIQGHLRTCPGCQATWADLAARQEKFNREFPMAEFVAGVLRRLEEKRVRRRRRLLVLAPAAAALVLLVVGILAWLPGGRPGVRTKGNEVALRHYVLRDGRAEPGVPGEGYRAGDRLQFVTTSPYRYVFLLSLDDRGRVSNFNPGEQASSVGVTPGSRQVIEGSVELDDSPSPERVFAIFSDGPLSWDEVEAGARRAYARLGETGNTLEDLEILPLDHPQASVLLEKVAGSPPR